MKKRVKRSTLVISLVAAVLVTAIICAALFIFVFPNVFPANTIAKKISEIENLVNEYYVGDYDSTEVGDYASEAFISSIGDKWSYYIPKEYRSQYDELLTNSYCGIGITISTQNQNGYFEILSVTPDGPAAKCGLREGDLIVEADGKSVKNMNVEELKSIIRGEEHTEVGVAYKRGEKITHVKIIREKINTEVAVCEVLDGNIGYIRIDNFDENSANQTISCIRELMDKKVKGIIFDVRDNPGGYKNELVQILDYILPEGDLFHSISYDGIADTDISDANCINCPMAVLVNEDSVSAAEFFAAALQEYGWATIVGTQTGGKGNYQNMFELSDGSAVNFSVGEYTTPLGKSLKDIGITPDIVLPLDEQTEQRYYDGTLPLSEDPQVLAAINSLR